MKLKMITLLYGFVAVVLLSSTSVFGQISPRTQIRTSAPEATADPQPDLTIKTLCFGRRPDKPNWAYVRVLVTNVGSVKADAFALGLSYIEIDRNKISPYAFLSPGDFESFAEYEKYEKYESGFKIKIFTKEIDGLKPGEEKWVYFIDPYSVDAFNMPWGTFAYVANSFKASADIGYTPAKDHKAQRYQLEKPRILESNENNNELTMKKSEMKDCIESLEMPKVQKISRP